MQAAAAPDDDAFARRLEVARGSDAALGLLSHIFSTRTLGLEKQLQPTEQADSLSGLLIGHEVQAALRTLLNHSTGECPPFWLIGERHLCERYTLAMHSYGISNYRILEQATEQGLWHLAVAQGLVQAAAAPATH